MVQIRRAAIDYEIKRFMRPDWRRFMRPGHGNDPLYRLYERIERKYRTSRAFQRATLRADNGQVNAEGQTHTGLLPNAISLWVAPAKPNGERRVIVRCG
jgi:hypothetical protein